jgi:hypothetical protein
MKTVLGQLPSSLTASLSNQTRAVLTGTTWFPHTIAPAFMSSLNVAFYFNAGLALLAAAASALRGKKYVYGREEEMEPVPVRMPAPKRKPAGRVDSGRSPSTAPRVGANESMTSNHVGKCNSDPKSVKASASSKGDDES